METLRRSLLHDEPVSDGYTSINVIEPIHLTEPQGIIKICNP